jgi:acyl phosphate:glycerol-3-phosphate acyltransferase
MTTLFGLLVAYLLGSLPFAVWVSRYLAHMDPRYIGDGNPGAKNVYHHVGHLEGFLVAGLDMGKGALAIYSGELLSLSTLGLFAMGFAVVIGHNWPFFMNFRGGQGMAATLGVLLVLAPMPALVGICFALITLLVLRNWDLAWTIGFAMVPITALLWDKNLTIMMYSICLIPMIGVRKLMQQAAVKNHLRRG